MVNTATLFWYQTAAKLLKCCQVSRDMWSRQFFEGSGRFVAVRCVNFTCANKNGCSKSYLLDLPVCALLECNCLHHRSSGKIFRITLYSELPRLTSSLPCHALLQQRTRCSSTPLVEGPQTEPLPTSSFLSPWPPECQPH